MALDNAWNGARARRARLSRRRFLAIGGGTLSAGFILACGGSDGGMTGATSDVAAPAATVEPGRYTTAPRTGKTRDLLALGVNGIPPTVDPAKELSNVGTRVSYSIFDTTIRRDFFDDNKLVPALAQSWERTDDLTLVLKLRDGVTFHTGDPFTAEDVAYTFARMENPEAELIEAKGYFISFDAVEPVDRLTVRITTKEPDPLIEKRLSSWASWIVPKGYVEKAGIAEFRRTGVATGPYRVGRLERDSRLSVERYDAYWSDKPPVKQIDFRVIPEVATRVTALLNGEVQIITNIPPDQVKTLQGAPNVEVRDIPLANMHTIYYNTHHPVLKSEKLRQAMNLGIDRRLLVDTLWNGRAVLTRSHQFEEYGPLYNPDRPYLPYDPQRAKALVAESGYKGDTVTYRTDPTYYTNGLQAGQAIVEMWKQIGINAEIKLVNSSDRLPPQENMVVNHSNSSVLADPDGAFWRIWGNTNTIQKNYWTPDPEFNRLGLEARTTLDERKRYENYQKMLDIWEKEAPGTVLYIPVENYGVNKEVNWSPYPFYYMDFRAYNLSFNK
jgi:peptide/nickel transport system substrate-binding protein